MNQPPRIPISPTTPRRRPPRVSMLRAAPLALRTLAMATLAVATLAVATSTLSGCGSDAVGVSPIFELGVIEDATGAFFDFPYPSDLRTDADGRATLQGFPRDRGLLGQALSALRAEGSGFSILTGVYLRFSGPLDVASLPGPEALLGDDSPIWMLDIDPASPAYGQRMPALVSFHLEADAIWAQNTLVVRAIPGAQLRPGTRYALVVRDGLLAASGQTVARSDAFEQVRASQGPAEIVGFYEELFSSLEGIGVDPSEIVVATSFTTADPAREMDALRAAVMAADLPPSSDWVITDPSPEMPVWEGSFETIRFMAGEPPFDAFFGDGKIEFDATGVPAVQLLERVGFVIALPSTPMPAEGYPLIIYGHGTGGDARTPIGSEADLLAAEGYAVLGFDAALHGGRNPSGLDVEGLLLSNPIAAREMVRQTVADMMMLFRMLREGSLMIPAARFGGVGGLFDPRRAYYMGHSQGSQEAGLLLGVEPEIDVAFLSEGGGGAIISIFERDFGGEPIACLIGQLALGVGCEDLSEDHPAMTLVLQPLLDPADPLPFAHRYYRERPAGARPLHMAMTEGTNDAATPPRTIEALAAAAGIPRVGPEVRSSLGLELAALPTQPVPATENLLLASGDRVTAGLYQWAGGSHFVIYTEPEAQRQYVEFFRTALLGSPVIVGP
ncbi:MAG: hypothetical protein OEY14_08280 [Myxococcales bacterium]|nr:hypothetical protein [Myxococcales bacterium]